MVFNCCIRTCNNSNRQKRMHVFPKDPDLFKKWFDAVQRTDITLAKRRSYRVCEVHFSELDKFEAFHNTTNLKRDSVPSLLLPSPMIKEIKKESEEQPNIVATEDPAVTATSTEEEGEIQIYENSFTHSLLPSPTIKKIKKTFEEQPEDPVIRSISTEEKGKIQIYRNSLTNSLLPSPTIKEIKKKSGKQPQIIATDHQVNSRSTEKNTNLWEFSHSLGSLTFTKSPTIKKIKKKSGMQPKIVATKDSVNSRSTQKKETKPTLLLITYETRL